MRDFSASSKHYETFPSLEYYVRFDISTKGTVPFGISTKGLIPCRISTEGLVPLGISMKGPMRFRISTAMAAKMLKRSLLGSILAISGARLLKRPKSA